MEQANDPRAGTVLDGKYEITRLIGEGGMGVVYEATHKLIGRKLAVKFLHSLYASNPDVVTRFQREAQAAAQIGHENIIEVTDMGCAPDGAPYIVMEYLDGTDVKNLLDRDGPFSVKRTALILVQTLSALEAAHAVGIVHRDMKPDNIFLTARGLNPDYVKLLDFGISKFRAFEDGVKRLTQTGTVLGTPHYMSPEQARGETPSHQSDIYATGVIMYQMLSGALPFDAPNYNALLMKVVSEDAVPLAEVAPTLPAPIVEIVETAMSRDLSVRYRTCSDMRARLLPFAPAVTEIGTLVAPTSSHAAIRQALYDAKTPYEMSEHEIKPPRVSKRALAIAAFALLVAVAIGVFFLAGGSSSNVAATAPKAIEATPANPTPAIPSQALKESAQEVVESVRTVRVKIAASPPQARISVDGAFIGTSSFEGDFSIDTAEHTVEVSADGYETEKKLVAFDADKSLEFSLEREGGDRSTKGSKSSRRDKKKSRKIDASDPW